MPNVNDLPERIRKKIEVNAETGCWEWSGRSQRGYGRMCEDRKNVFVHRVVFRLLSGPLIDGLTIDHLCRNRSCCNPSRLEQVEMGVNVLRGYNPLAINARKEHCRRCGGPYTTFYVDGRARRDCMPCRRDLKNARGRQRRAERRALLAAIEAHEG